MRILVRRDNDLFVSLVKAVKCMKKFILAGIFASQKLNVVNEQNITVVSEFFTESIKAFFANG